MRSCRTAGAWGTAAFTLTALLAAGCSAAHTPPAPTRVPPVPGTTRNGPARGALAAQYMTIAAPANHHLDADFDGLEKHERGDLARAQADLRDAAATEDLFDRRLLAIAFPARTEQIARALVWLNESRAALTAAAAAAPTLAQLRRYEPRLSAANAPVEQAVWLIRGELGLPPPDTS